MANTIKGTGAIWGVGGVTCTGVTVDPTTCRIQKVDFTKDAEIAELPDENGEVVGENYYNQKHMMDISLIPSGATIAAAKSNLTSLLPDPGTAIVLVDADTTATDGSNAGTYVVQSAKLGRTNKGFATIDLKIKQFKAHDVSATISS
jgi:hypothetical protein